MKKLFAILIVFLVLVISAAGYTITRPKDTRIQLSGILLTVELATTPDAQRQGLSNRASLQADHGMLFVFDHEDYWGFWMIQMNFPLDIIWFNADRQVVFIEQNLQPCSPQYCPVNTPSTKALYVLEVNADFVAIHGISLGAPFTFVNT